MLGDDAGGDATTDDHVRGAVRMVLLNVVFAVLARMRVLIHRFGIMIGPVLTG